MTEPEPRAEIQRASDGYPSHVLVWPAVGTLRGKVVVLHGVQSHGGWYHDLGRTLAAAGFETHFPDRRGSGANTTDRGHAPSARRLIDDVAELLRTFRDSPQRVPLALAGISWGGKTAVITAADHPDLIDGLVLICPGLHPRVGVSVGERLRIAWAFLTDRHKTFPIPLSDPALFTANPDRQRFIAADPFSLRAATAGLMATSTFIDRRVRRAPPRVHRPVLLMLAGQDRIVNNARTLESFQRLASRDKVLIQYPDAHHTLEFEPDPSRYAHDLIGWLGHLSLGKTAPQAVGSDDREPPSPRMQGTIR
jgi:alpha-beta hydrolase superfamily lysophospholipase